jgi:lipoyl(octanoyl) transferase
MTVADRSSDELWVCHLGVVPYRDALAIQEDIRRRRQAGELPDVLLLLEHPPVYTRGRRSGAEDLPFGDDFHRAKGVDVVDTDRGGRVTYHGPGQLVGYPIMAIHDIGRHLRTIEHAIVAALGEVGVRARSRHHEGIDYTGVWVATPRGTPEGRTAGERKIASIGVHVSRGISTHGFAVNVDNDLQPFSWVIACGLPDVRMTSLAAESSSAECWPISDRSLSCFRRRIAYAFCQAHGRRQRLVSSRRLGIDTANQPRLAERVPINTISSPLAQPAGALQGVLA